MFLETLFATLEIGLPMLGLSWFLFSWLYGKGDIDRDADDKTVEKQLKALSKNRKKEKKRLAKAHAREKALKKQKEKAKKQALDNSEESEAEDDAEPIDYAEETDEENQIDLDEKLKRTNAEYVFEQWLTFGGGFYGLAALWTFVVIEAVQLFQFVVFFPGLEELLRDGVFDLIINIIINQLSNVVQAFVWFAYWEQSSVLITVIIAYAGYRIGKELAKRGHELPVEQWLEKFRNRKQ